MGQVSRLALTALAVLLTGAPALATTWSDIKADDPFGEAECPVTVVLSYGSYIYDWPSKYDGVFFPATHEWWLWFCPGSGYAALGSDFKDLSEDEMDRIGWYLRQHYRPSEPPEGILERLAWAEEIYRLRDEDDAFWAFFYRLVVYWSGEKGDPERAERYARKALPLMERLAESTPAGPDRIRYLFLAGEYHRRLGDGATACAYFVRVGEVAWIDEDGEARVGLDYYEELVADRVRLMPLECEAAPGPPGTGPAEDAGEAGDIG